MNEITVLDHVEVKKGDGRKNVLSNTSNYDAVYTILVETAVERSEPLDEGWFLCLPEYNVKAGTEEVVDY